VTTGTKLDGAGRTAVVTGGSAGIGLAVSEALSAHGYHVISLDLVEPSTSGIDYRRVDVTSTAEVDSTYDAIARERGAIDVAVHSAGISDSVPLLDMNESRWLRVMNVNLNGVFRGTRAAGRHMCKAGRGSIVNMSSIAATRGAAGRASYVAAKAAVEGLTRTAAVEWARAGVRVNAVAPGYVDTALVARAVSEGRINLNEIRGRIPMGRMASPEEIAATVTFLASDSAAYTTGQVLTVDGGFSTEYGVTATDKETGP
jgi:3-oxoacyl-[acyl-carrier protein] reductase